MCDMTKPLVSLAAVCLKCDSWCVYMLLAKVLREVYIYCSNLVPSVK